MFGVGTGVIAMLAVFGDRVFNEGDVGIGILFAARGLGALVGPFVAQGNRRDFGSRAVGRYFSLNRHRGHLVRALPACAVDPRCRGTGLRRSPGRRRAVDALDLRPSTPYAGRHPRPRLQLRLWPGDADHRPVHAARGHPVGGASTAGGRVDDGRTAGDLRQRVDLVQHARTKARITQRATTATT